MTTHKLKILPEYFQAVQEGKKTFELRTNDRGFEVGDKIILQEGEYDFPIVNGTFKGFEYTGQEIEKEISYILNGGKYGLEEGYCILGLKQDGIILKNIDLTGISKLEQGKKANEENNEFHQAFREYIYYKNEKNKNHLIEEWWDKNQAELGVLEKEGITAEEVQAYYPQHLEKLKSRPRKK